jgi:hypothetical protein
MVQELKGEEHLIHEDGKVLEEERESCFLEK